MSNGTGGGGGALFWFFVLVLCFGIRSLMRFFCFFVVKLFFLLYFIKISAHPPPPLERWVPMDSPILDVLEDSDSKIYIKVGVLLLFLALF